MAKIAIMGFGTVGSGVLEVLRRGAASIRRRAGEPVEVKYILDVRDFSSSPDAALFVKDINVILADPEVKVVVETRGGTPVIAPLHECLAANRVLEIEGIVNGTTNFMLTKMVQEGMGFDEALAIAQSLGYAETKDPSDDVDGADAARKIAILASIAYGSQIHTENLPTRGIRAITAGDVKEAAALGCAIKLIAWCRQAQDGTVYAGVEPMLVPRKNHLARVDDVFNAVLVKGDMVGDVIFYGKGAGKLPTASAVVADVVEALREGVRVHDSLFWQPGEKAEGLVYDPQPADWYLRAGGCREKELSAALGGAALEKQGEGWLARQVCSAQVADAEKALAAQGARLELALRRMKD